MPIPKFVVTAALMAAQVALGATQRTKGPRLESLKTTTADYGTPIPRFWGKRKFECPVIWAEDLRETKKTSKGKSGKNTQYKYFATFGVLICDHEIDAVTRIWMDEKLVYQTTEAGPVSIGAAANLTVGGNMRIYLGTEDQEADPRMEAWCDDRYGANSCPAYRGSAYIVFEELPVNNFGNRIPNITVEAVNNKTNIYPWEYTSAPSTFGQTVEFSPDGTTLYAISSDFQAWDVANRSLIAYRTFPSGISYAYAFTDSGIFAINITGDTGYFISFDGAIQTIGSLDHVGWDGVFSAGGLLYLSAGSFAGMNIGVWGGSTAVARIGTTCFPTFYFTNTDGDAVFLGWDGTAHNFAIGMASDGVATSIDTTAYGTSGGAYGFDNGTNYVVRHGDHLFLIDKSTYAVVSAVSAPSTAYTFATYLQVQPGADFWWEGGEKRSSADLSLLQSATLADWVGSGRALESSGTLYSAVNDALLSFTTDPGITWRYLDRISSSGVTLKTVVDSVSEWCGLTGQDTSALTQTVLGYSVTQGSGKDMIAPLLDIHDVDCRPHDFQVQFVNRGGSPSGTLLTEDFVRNGDRYKVTIKQDTDLPKEVTINFADWDHDQNPNNVISARPALASSSSRSETIDLSTYADTADGAQRKADRFIRRAWNSRESANLSLTAQCLALEPADVTTISLDGALRNVRLNKMTIASQQIDCEFIRDETAFAVLNSATGPTFDGTDTDTIVIPGPTRGFILDAPLVLDSDNNVNPVLYYAAGGYTPGWMGAGVYRGDDGTYDEDFATVDSSQNATWGSTDTALATANANLWDRGNTLDVTVYGTLTTHTEAELNADETVNLAAIGEDGRWEYVQFATATLTGTSGPANTYTLSGFRRGRRGTESNVGNHAVGDSFVLLDRAYAAELGAGDLGVSMSFKIQSFGRDPDAAAPISLTYDANSLKPYAPARVKWVYDGTDLQGTIIRRTRVGGSWNGSTISLGETSEAYEVEIYNGVTLKRTVSVSGTNTFTYTSAMASADGITLPTPPSIQAYQLSTTVGRGFALAG